MKKEIINTMETLIKQKHCYMCRYFVRSQIPKDRGTCIVLDTYYPYKLSKIQCDGKSFNEGGYNSDIYNKLKYLKKN